MHKQFMGMVQGIPVKGSVGFSSMGQSSAVAPSPSRARFEWVVGKLCSLMRNDEASDEQKAKLFWAYVKNAGSSEESVLTAYKTLCPEYDAPVRPFGSIPTGTAGIGQLSYSEAQELYGLLNGTLETVDIEKAECVRGFVSGDFIQSEALRQQLQQFLASGDVRAIFFVSNSDIEGSGRAINCILDWSR